MSPFGTDPASDRIATCTEIVIDRRKPSGRIRWLYLRIEHANGLPWQECPGAVASAARITGMTLQELHFRVRRELSGTSTCTHLNDLLRSVADVEALIARLRC